MNCMTRSKLINVIDLFLLSAHSLLADNNEKQARDTAREQRGEKRGIPNLEQARNRIE